MLSMLFSTGMLEMSSFLLFWICFHNLLESCDSSLTNAALKFSKEFIFLDWGLRIVGGNCVLYQHFLATSLSWVLLTTWVNIFTFIWNLRWLKVKHRKSSTFYIGVGFPFSEDKDIY